MTYEPIPGDTRVEAVTCPLCLAEPGEPCESLWSGEPRWPHLAREDAACPVPDGCIRWQQTWAVHDRPETFATVQARAQQALDEALDAEAKVSEQVQQALIRCADLARWGRGEA